MDTKFLPRRTIIQPPAHVHLVGVAGVGMSALAQVLLAQGFKVTGSDRYLDSGQELSVLDKLRRAGVGLVPQDGAGVRPDTAGVVVSTAIEPDNPDLAAARRLGVPIIHRAEMLARLARSVTTIAVTGTAGKTTVTGMIGWVLEQMGLDPMVVNGGAVLNWMTDDAIGNVRIGQGAIWVLEADESDRSLLQFDPDWAVITNISKDHFELDEVRRLFQEFACKVRRGVVGCYGAPPDFPDTFQPRLSAQGCAFDYQGVVFEITMLGRHNAENALHCVRMCERLGLSLPEVSRALTTFRGIQRRLEWIGKAKGVTVIDDYAHNPAKITAAWQAVAPHFKRVIAVWRPHGFAPLALMMEELTRAFAAVIRGDDRVLIMPVYYAGGTVQATVDSVRLVERLARAGVAAEAVGGYDDLQARLLALARSDDVVLFMGARDPFLPVFALRLVFELDHFLVDRVSGAR
ncbi:MAG: hypothetical protein KKG09_09095 [Verrucomicrobia bacterium]|nr:hypothetical protein [Verrucomicrobiota bacterium]MCG2680125.1 Mur ligase domain-containing protein [Kiritimatiellia bacterium]MBU4247034.1 hypothetical protein [Verrucomicrobiota bacterium]MBU4291108.1 hypothetical protein [Verrucomicrobiota bacterium]MBU4429911.1 hypothetical protein [Verrucomicrobiota bacterium]